MGGTGIPDRWIIVTPTIGPVVSVLFAFAAAFANALNVVTQHVASIAAPPREKGWRLALYLVRNPLWLLGVGAMVAGFAFQAVALYDGQLSVVQTILVTELVFTLVIGRVWLRRDVVPAAWASASVTSAGLALFLIMAEDTRAASATARAAMMAVTRDRTTRLLIGSLEPPFAMAGL